MRQLKWIIAAIIVAAAVALAVANAEVLRQEIIFKTALTNLFAPAGGAAMPLWLTLLAAAALAFFGAIGLEMVAWYQYTRIIRLQRLQILELQKALREKQGAA